MSKFKVGDSVRVIASEHGAPSSTVGQIGVVTRESGNYRVKFTDEHRGEYEWSYVYEELELATPKPKTNLRDLSKSALDKPKSDSGELVTNQQGGQKYDGNKRDYTLLLQDLKLTVDEVVDVLDIGQKKYSRCNFSKVESERYHRAALRHLMSYLSGEQNDPETGKHHLAHLICCAAFLIEREVKKEEK